VSPDSNIGGETAKSLLDARVVPGTQFIECSECSLDSDGNIGTREITASLSKSRRQNSAYKQTHYFIKNSGQKPEFLISIYLVLSI